MVLFGVRMTSRRRNDFLQILVFFGVRMTSRRRNDLTQATVAAGGGRSGVCTVHI